MSSQSHIRETFTRHWNFPGESGTDAWLIKGDFDHFKLTNDLYGALIADYLLDWTLEVIEAVLRYQQKRRGCDELLCNLMGDDVTIYIPPSTLTADDVTQLLWKIREAIRQSFWRRYIVGTLPLPADFFEDIPADLLEMMKNELEKLDVVLDFAIRQRGFLLLFPIGADGKTREIPGKVIDIIQRRTGKPFPAVELQLDWVTNPDDQTCHIFNHGFIDPPQVSFAACPVRMGWAGNDKPPGYEQISFACQSALKVCKQQHQGVLLYQDVNAPADMPAYPAAIPPFDPPSPLRWSSERYLREILYFRQLDQPVLFQLNPVYTLTSRMPMDAVQIEKYRGNAHGIGLKGINEISGQNSADRLIRQLISLFSEGVCSVLAGKGIPADRVFAGQFVDRLTVCCEQSIFHLLDIVELVRCLVTQFNAVSDEIKISHLRTSLVYGEAHLAGYRLFDQLALTSLASQSSTLINADPPIEVRHNSSFALQEGGMTLERNSFSSAKLLSVYNGCVL